MNDRIAALTQAIEELHREVDALQKEVGVNYRRIEDDEYIQQGDFCGPQGESKYTVITNADALGQIASIIRDRFKGYEFYTLRKPRVPPLLIGPILTQEDADKLFASLV